MPPTWLKVSEEEREGGMEKRIWRPVTTTKTHAKKEKRRERHRSRHQKGLRISQ
jgi:hypothetical protein